VKPINAAAKSLIFKPGKDRFIIPDAQTAQWRRVAEMTPLADAAGRRFGPIKAENILAPDARSVIG